MMIRPFIFSHLLVSILLAACAAACGGEAGAVPPCDAVPAAGGAAPAQRGNPRALKQDPEVHGQTTRTTTSGAGGEAGAP